MEILYINTSNYNAKIGLISDNKSKFLKFQAKNRLSNILLTRIDKLLKENKIVPKKLKAIAVFKGPGSFTGLRIGIATANAFTFSLKIPLIEIDKEDNSLAKIIREKFKNKIFTNIIIPFYGKPPNITKPKTKK